MRTVPSEEQVVPTLVAFQRAMMDAITELDPRTPLFVGPAWNYNTLGYRWDDYATAFSAYAGRLVYEVNLLQPKSYVDAGADPDGAPVSYPILATPPVDAAALTAALLDTPVAGLAHPYDDEDIARANRDLADVFPMLLAPAYPAWHLGFAAAFAAAHDVPMVLDQFGATVDAGGQLAYEDAVIAAAEAAGMGWCRWLYSADHGDEQERDIAHNPVVHGHYAP